MKYFKIIIAVSFFVIITQGCSTSDSTDSIVDPVNCTAEFVSSSITVLDPAGNPADSVKITVQNENSNRYYDLCEEDTCYTNQQGAAVIMNDAFRAQLKEEGHNILVQGTKAELSFEEKFEFTPGVCHIKKIAGPDTLSLSMD